MNNKSGSERGELIETLKKVACKTYLGNHKFHHILNNHECEDGYMVWEDLADHFIHLQKLCEEQKGEIERLKSDSSSGLSVKYKLELLKEINNLKSQLATQKERVRQLKNDLRRFGFHRPECNRYIWDGWTTLENGTKYALLAEDMNCACTCGFEQALNQESLGDGGKGE